VELGTASMVSEAVEGKIVENVEIERRRSCF
jgi:hypothetical protein